MMKSYITFAGLSVVSLIKFSVEGTTPSCQPMYDRLEIQLALVQDTTASYEQFVPALQNAYTPIMKNVSKNYPGSTFSLSTFRDVDFAAPTCYETSVPMTEDHSVLVDAIKKTKTKGGETYHEWSLGAIVSATYDDAIKWNNQDEYIDKDNKRVRVFRILALTTDNHSKDWNTPEPETENRPPNSGDQVDNCYTQQAASPELAARALKRHDISLLALIASKPTESIYRAWEGYLDAIAQQGVYTNIQSLTLDAVPEDIADAFLDGINEVVCKPPPELEVCETFYEYAEVVSADPPVGKSDAMTSLDCARICNLTFHCVYWSLSPDGECTHYSSIKEFRTTSKRVISGNAGCTPITIIGGNPPAEYRCAFFESNTAYYGEEVAFIPGVKDYLSCAYICNRDDRCEAWTYTSDSQQTCYLRASFEGKEANDLAASSTKMCKEVEPTPKPTTEKPTEEPTTEQPEESTLSEESDSGTDVLPIAIGSAAAVGAAAAIGGAVYYLSPAGGPPTPVMDGLWDDAVTSPVAVEEGMEATADMSGFQ